MGKQQNIEISPIRAYYNDSDKQNSDWDQILPISVFDAIYETSDPGSENLTQFKAAINTRINNLILENQLPAGGNIGDVIAMTENGPQWRSLEEMIEEINAKYNHEDTPVAIIDFKDENTVNLSAGQYTINGELYTLDSTGKLPIDPSWFGTTISIIKKASGAGKIDSAPQVLPIPSKPAKPVLSSAPDSGTITGVNNTMEYRVLNGTWTPITGSSITGLTAGTYEVRVKYVPNVSFCSDVETISVTESVGWELTYDYPGTNTVITSANGRLTLSTWDGYNGQSLDENVLYDSELKSMDDIKVRLFAKFVTDEDFVEVPFDNFGLGVSEPNKIQRWGYVGVGDGYIQLYGSNSTGVNIQLRLVKEV